MSSEFITLKFEKGDRRFEYDKDTMMLTMIDTYNVNRNEIPEIIENIKRLKEEL